MYLSNGFLKKSNKFFLLSKTTIPINNIINNNITSNIKNNIEKIKNERIERFIKNNKLKNIGKKIEMQESHSSKPFVIKKIDF